MKHYRLQEAFLSLALSLAGFIAAINDIFKLFEKILNHVK